MWASTNVAIAPGATNAKAGPESSSTTEKGVGEEKRQAGHIRKGEGDCLAAALVSLERRVRTSTFQSNLFHFFLLEIFPCL